MDIVKPIHCFAILKMEWTHKDSKSTTKQEKQENMKLD